jgi:hypothetical protein
MYFVKIQRTRKVAIARSRVGLERVRVPLHWSLRITAACLAAYLISPIARADNIFQDFGREVGNCFSGGCDVIWHLNQRFDQGLQSKSESLVGPAKQAFDDSMRQLFDDRLTPMIQMVNAMAAARIWQAQIAADDVIRTAETGVDSILDHAAIVANSVTTNIKQTILDAAYADATALVKQIHDQALDVIDKADCAVAGTFDNARLTVANLFSIGNPFDKCFRDAGFYTLGAPRSDDYLSIYRIRQCQLESGLSDRMTVTQIADQYVRLAAWSQTMRCVMRRTNAAVDLIEKDIGHYTQSYRLWSEVAAQ